MNWFKDFFKAFFVFLLLQIFVIQGFVIEGSCMEPELHSEEKIIVNKMIYKLREPKHGEVVVFKYPLEPEKDFIKRVVGLPGDEISIKNGSLYRNQEKLDEDYVKEYVFGNYGPVMVPQGQLCVMGDNRNNSHDSRTWGMLDESLLKGRAELTFWPPKAFGLVHNSKE